MTSQQLGDLALEEHRAVMAALIKNSISCPTEDQYKAVLDALRSTMSCVISTLPFSSPSSARS